MGVFPRKAILKDYTLPWPASKATLNVAQTLTDPKASHTTKIKRNLLLTSTAVSSFLRDGFGVIRPVVANPSLNMALGHELAAFGIGMLVPLSVGLSGLLGLWLVNIFGETVAKYAALSGVSKEHFDICLNMLNNPSSI
jgi:uncharacterized oligopeptide transporter (OPT) family protein